jgi:hypothetical protein
MHPAHFARAPSAGVSSHLAPPSRPRIPVTGVLRRPPARLPQRAKAAAQGATTLPDGRSVALGPAPVTDQQGGAGLTGKVDNHWGCLFGAVFFGGAMRGGQQALQIGLAQASGAGQVASGIAATSRQVAQQRVGRALNWQLSLVKGCIMVGRVCVALWNVVSL